MMRRSEFIRAVAIGLLALPFMADGVARADEPASSAAQAAQVRFFETSIRPLFAEHCLRCHGPDKQRGELRLDARANILKGGVSGPAVAPGEPEHSLLIKAVSHRDPEFKMPPDQKLSDRQIADLTRWVKMGAPFPPDAVAAKGTTGRDHWAFKAPADPPIPAVKDTTWGRLPLDRFILAQLEAKGLRPAPPADRRTLIRRATFDLIGLPPTPAEVEAFLADKSPDALAKVVERLLASPHYGERWGRHWLDVARYADSNGLDENVAFGNAWRYRDYVVAAFNRDVPYDRFLREQIAGDLLPAADEEQRREQLIATGFLALGPKVLAEVDEKKMEMDILDEQVDTLGRAVLGLTLGCARCHNHKFDPISLEDYYGLLGIFQSTKTMEHFKKVAKWHENPLVGPEEVARKEAHDQAVVKTQAAIKTLTAKLKAKPTPKHDGEAFDVKKAQAELDNLRRELAQLEKTAPVIPTALGVAEGVVADAAVLPRGNHLNPGAPVPRRFPTVLAPKQPLPLSATQSGRMELAEWLTRKDHPLTARVMVNRVWRWHSGQGIVASTDNFGLLGDRPSHPELLDWLAHRFMDSGWSIKELHRLIMLSSTYQMSTAYDAKAAEADPENRLLWRMTPRRLEAEALRDAVLATSGLLDRTMGGSLLHVGNREYLFDHTSKDKTTYDSRRRSLYLPVIRNNLYDVFQLFDATDATVSSGDRATTTVATQALFWLNSDLVAQAAKHLAEDVLSQKDIDDNRRIDLLHRRAYGRPATAAELERGAAALADLEESLDEPGTTEQRRLRAWSLYCQVILAANEFVTRP
jgi:mono/diheme cytochrome c family protein